MLSKKVASKKKRQASAAFDDVYKKIKFTQVNKKSVKE